MYKIKTFIRYGNSPLEVWREISLDFGGLGGLEDVHISSVNFRITKISDYNFSASAVISYKILPLAESQSASEINTISLGEEYTPYEYPSHNEALQALMQRFDEETIQESRIITHLQYDIISYLVEGTEKHFAYGLYLSELDMYKRLEKKISTLALNEEDIMNTLESKRFNLWGILKYGKAYGFTMSSELYPPGYKIEYP
ncbi:MAG: hypothetical protein EOO43_07880 [Flavobacterium sp.]|nr:MAG: hypothetical protein EOO43_07880 [Flavobacterium sp.]